MIAVNLGAYLAKKHKKETFSVYDIQRKDEKTHLETFSLFMNSTAKVVGLQMTNVVSMLPFERHLNTTCADDIAKLSIQAAKIPLFQRINSLPKYTVKATSVDDQGEMKQRTFVT